MTTPQKLSTHFNKSLLDVPVATILEEANRLRGKNDFKQSLLLLNDALALHPENPTIWRDIGSTFLAQRHPDLALPYFKKAHELDPKNLSFAISYANRLRKDGYCDGAEKILMPFVPKCHNDPEKTRTLFELLGQTYFNGKNMVLAATCFDRALSLGSTHSEVKKHSKKLGHAGITATPEGWDAFVDRLTQVLGQTVQKALTPPPPSPEFQN
jgi:tetratricopeptide (TPR) repeat protein